MIRTSHRDDVLLGERHDLTRRVTERLQDGLRVLAFLWHPRGIPGLRRGVLRRMGDDLKLPDPRHVDRRVAAAGLDLRIPDALADLVDYGDRELFRAEDPLPCFDRPLPGPRGGCFGNAGPARDFR